MKESNHILNQTQTGALQEHSEQVYLFIHEDQMAWRLNMGYLAANAALIALITQIPNFH